MPAPSGTTLKVRRSDRHRVLLEIPMRLAMRGATLVDVAENGILATHARVLKTGTVVAIEFTHGDEKFEATGSVQTCTVIALNPDETGTIYASRIFFTSMSDSSRRLLARILAQ